MINPIHKLALVVAACALVFSTLTVAQAAPTSAPDKTLMQKIWTAWSTRNPDNAAPFYSHENTSVFYPLAPMKVVGWNAYASEVRKLMSEYSSVDVRVGDDAEVQSGLTFAYGTATLHATQVFTDGRRETRDSRWTVVWEKRGEKWLVVHEHVSAPLPGRLEKQSGQ
jgi:ketosteroid isomerase-like protein